MSQRRSRKRKSSLSTSLAVGAIDYMSIVRFSEVLEVEFLDTIVIEIDVIAFSDIEDALNL